MKIKGKVTKATKVVLQSWIKAIAKPLKKADILEIYKFTTVEVNPLTSYVSLPSLAVKVPALFSASSNQETLIFIIF